LAAILAVEARNHALSGALHVASRALEINKRFRQTGLAIEDLKMKRLYIIGIGTGNPDHLTMQAITALNKARVVFIPRKGDDKRELAQVRRDICARFISNAETAIVEYDVPERGSASGGYTHSVDEWHAALAKIYLAMFLEQVPADGSAAFLVWGDPSLYDSTIRIVERVKALHEIDFDYEVVPGITSIQSLTASHRIPLNLVGKPVQITTGRRLVESFPAHAESVVVMLDGEEAFGKIDDPDASIYWGAYLGTEHEIIVSGRLADVADRIREMRRSAREQHGWIMDIYLLRKGRDFDD
jgi:precorrin-6A synthase